MDAGGATVEFDEGWYRRRYPDVRLAIEQGLVESGLGHFLAHGRQEGRQPTARFDDGWYESTYPLARAEIDGGYEGVARRHFEEVGRHRGYLPCRHAVRPVPAGDRPFGSLWTDRPNAVDLIAGKQEIGFFGERDAVALRHFAERGFVVLPAAVSLAMIDLGRRAVEEARSGRFAGAQVDRPPGGPAMLVDPHWTSAAIRDLLLAPRLARLMQLILERPLLLTRSRIGPPDGFARGLRQECADQAFTVPRHFVGCLLALDDAGGASVACLSGSHRELDDFLYPGGAKSVPEARRLGASEPLLVDAALRHRSWLEGERVRLALAEERVRLARGDAVLLHPDLAYSVAPAGSGDLLHGCLCAREALPVEGEEARLPIREHGGRHLYAVVDLRPRDEVAR